MTVRILIDVDFLAHMARGLCSFCRKRVTEKNGFLELYSARDGKLFYPNEGPEYEAVAFFTHAPCGPDCGYTIKFSSVADDPDDWLQHIAGKVWGCPLYTHAIGMAADCISKRRLSVRASRL